MATARKTESGMWRIRCLSHTDENKKKHYISITAATKALAEQKAAAFNRKKKLAKRHDFTVEEAIIQFFKACIACNGFPFPVTKKELLDVQGD